MPYEPDELTRMLREAPCHVLSDYQQHLLAARCGADAKFHEMAEAWNFSEDVIRKDFGRIQDVVVGRLGFEHSDTLITRWFDLQLDICLPYAKQLIEQRRVFAGPPPVKPRKGMRAAAGGH